MQMLLCHSLLGQWDHMNRQPFVNVEIHQPVIHDVEHTKAILRVGIGVYVYANGVFPPGDAEDGIRVYRLNAVLHLSNGLLYLFVPCNGLHATPPYLVRCAATACTK